MGLYRVDVPVTFLVEITEENQTNTDRPALMGDSTTVAMRRALWCLFSTDRASDWKKLGIKSIRVDAPFDNFAKEIKPDSTSPPPKPTDE